MSGAAAIAVYLIDLVALAASLDEIECSQRVLTPEERAWCTGEPLNQSVMRARARIALRLLLRSHGAPDAIRSPFAQGPHGKPRLACGALDFNLSHAGEHSLVAIGPAGTGIGVDLEASRDVDIPPSRAAQLIAAATAMGGDLPADLGDTERILVAWTRLEALAKARGTGIGQLLSDLDLTAAAARSRSLDDTWRLAQSFKHATGIGVATLDVPARLFGAIAAAQSLLVEIPIVTMLDEGDLVVLARSCDTTAPST